METINVTLPDGSVRAFPRGTPLDGIARVFDPKIARVALAAIVDGAQKDIYLTLDHDAVVSFITPDAPQALEIYRHTTSHLLAHAVKALFPEVKIGIGPATEEGFFYDFERPTPFAPEDLERIEAKMREIKARDLPIRRLEQPKEEALAYFRRQGDNLKVELVSEKGGAVVSCYRQDDFMDFCTGPHVPSTGRLGAFKLLSLAGAYWKGSEKNQQLQRIYGTAFAHEEQLKAHLEMLEEAKKRDHRRLGPALDLFSVEETAGPGLIFWHPHGTIVRQVLEDYWKEQHRRHGYQLVTTPHIARDELWRLSGHLEYYKENMYTFEIDEAGYVLKPMNCPGHSLIYKSRLRSYRELPIRYAELGTVYRYERSGVLHGMMRVRGFTQDDAHIYCTRDQVLSEIEGVLDLCVDFLKTFGYERYEVDLSVWDKTHPEKYAGDASGWEMAEDALTRALQERGLRYLRREGEAAFYGPKIDFKMFDAIGRPWQGPTVQFDFNLPQRLGIHYVSSDSSQVPVVMVHRAIYGSLERFMGGLVEHYAGAFPLWLAPVQAVVLPITDRTRDYALEVRRTLQAAGLRVECDERNEKIGAKIRDAQLRKIPFMLVAGDREAQARTVAVRSRRAGDLGPMSLEAIRDRMVTMQVEREPGP
ncbi:MAG TPA: threonine--tRNA ligase [Candidatus Polarisedimenticolia bacterium]|nr:threonine--tRNA ligase [Candidatus Polarisedimenticolia bacterium]